MKHFEDYDQENKEWTLEPLPRWFVVLLTIATIICFAVLVMLPGPVG